MNIVELQSTLKSVPDQVLVKYVQAPRPEVPQYLALAEIQRRKKLRDAGQAQQATQQSTPQSVADEGIAGVVNQDMYSDQSFAGGGIVSFAEGGSTYKKTFTFPPNDDPWFNEIKRLNRVGTKLSPVPVAPAQLLTTPQIDHYYDRPYTDEIRRRGAGFFSGDNSVYEPPFPPIGNQTGAPLNTDGIPLSSHSPNPATPATSPVPQPAGGGSTTVRSTNTARQAGITTLPQAQQASPLTWNKLTSNGTGYDAMMEPDTTAEAERNAMRAALGENAGLVGLKERLGKLDASAQKESDRAPWMALVQAGLGMAAGQSPNAITNIAEGAKQGMTSYAQARERINEMEEKRFSLANQLAQAERQEEVMIAKFGEESAQAKKAQRRTVQLAKLNNQNEIDLVNTKGMFEAAKGNADIGLKRDEMAQKERLANAQMANDRGIASIRAANTGMGGMNKAELTYQLGLLKEEQDAAEAKLKDMGKVFGSEKKDPKFVAKKQALENTITTLSQQRSYLLQQTGVPVLPQQAQSVTPDVSYMKRVKD